MIQPGCGGVRTPRFLQFIRHVVDTGFLPAAHRHSTHCSRLPEAPSDTPPEPGETLGAFDHRAVVRDDRTKSGDNPLCDRPSGRYAALHPVDIQIVVSLQS
ncbi:hypothetical protein J2802_002927 [Paraburkholderia caribensis]|nr:hypothetical protein [Paraburkholderia caribensis]